MTLQQLKYAVTVAECRTISKAAEKVFISQPSLTAAIRQLEDEMNVKIFSRTNKGIEITKDGEIFLSYARQRFLNRRTCSRKNSQESEVQIRFSAFLASTTRLR